MNVLVAEDDWTSAVLIEQTLGAAGLRAVIASDGAQALTIARSFRFDAVITDWMMPTIDGIELIRRLRARDNEGPPPAIVMVTAIDSPEARSHALSSGADAFLAKPVRPQEVISTLRECTERRQQPVPELQHPTSSFVGDGPPEFSALCIATSTGGPMALETLVPRLGALPTAAAFVVQHGPAWMVESLAQRLDALSAARVRLASDGTAIEPGTIYIAPGNRHLVIDSKLCTALRATPPEGNARPAANPLFRSAASVFGPKTVAVVLTGLGRDGAVGAEHVRGVGGVVIAQNPRTAIAPFMPEGIVKLGLASQVLELEEIGGGVLAVLWRQSAHQRTTQR